MNSYRLRLGLAFLITAAAFATFALIFWEFMRDTIVIPLYYLMWVGDLIVKSIPEGAFLAVLLLICIIIASSGLQNVQSASANQSDRRILSRNSARYLFWRRLYQHLIKGELSRNQFAWEARKMILSILAYQEGADISQAEAMVIDGRMSVPPAVKNLIQQREIRASAQTVTTYRKWEMRVRRLFTKVERPVDSLVKQQIDDIVAFIEYRLEITHASNPSES